MTESNDDTGVLMALVERFEKFRLPRALALKSKVESGATLDDSELAFLEQVGADSRQIHALVERHPEYQQLAVRASQLFTEIARRAAANETSGRE
jgi:hypothetical protein